MSAASPRDLPELEGFSIGEVAALLHVTDKTVRREIDRGLLRSFRVGRAIRVSRGAIEDYVGGDKR